MLEVSSLRSPSKADQRGFVVGDHVGSGGGFPSGCDDFMVDDNLLDYIDFSCEVPSLFDADGDILPDLEVDPAELLAEFAEYSQIIGGDHDDEANKPPPPPDDVHQEQVAAVETTTTTTAQEDPDRKKKKTKGEESAVTEDSSSAGSDTKSSSVSAAGHHHHSKTKKQASSAAAKNSNNGKRKVDWTPELHRRFVQAVEQLGIDKAVPSRILEIMGIECLTRHNIASHLQKYRSHRKHLMAREAEAASWAQKRHMYAAAAAPAARKAANWVVPTLGFPPHAPPPPPPPPFCRPLHVWGHPPTAVDAPATTMLPMWPRHLAPPRPWPPVDPASYWQHQQQYNAAAGRKWGGGPAVVHHQAAVTQGTPCVAPPPAMVQPPPRPFPPPHLMYSRPPPMTTMLPPPPPPPIITTRLADLQLQLDAHPSKESIDAAIGDVLGKPWLPLPLGLKPPSLDSVMSELHKQGIPNVPPPTLLMP